MERDVELGCKCAAVAGRVQAVSAATVNRVICYCADCQTFLHHLGRAELLDAQGGSDIIQVAPARVSFQRGRQNIAAIRLGPRGPYRFYASCCRTPLGNTVKPSLPFIGLVFEALVEARDPARREALFGPPRGRIWGSSAIGTPPPGSTGMNLRLFLRTARLILGWKLGGLAAPHPYFEPGSDEPCYPVRLLSKEERAEARRHAGPRPA